MLRTYRFLAVLALIALIAAACAPVPTPTPMPVSTRTRILTPTATRMRPTSTLIRVLPTQPQAPTATQIRPTATLIGIRPTQTGAALQMDLAKADLEGKVKCTITGDGLEYIDVTLELSTEGPLEVAIAPGTVFQAMSSGVQSMVVTQPRTVLLQSRGAKVSVELEVACATMELDQPKSTDTFTIRRETTGPDLLKLLSLPDLRGQSFRVQQFAIWTITDNPSKSGYIGIGSFGLGSGPSEDELQKIRTLFEKAGITVSKYQALR